MLSITFVRHGQSEANVAERWQGHGDSALSEHGRAQAEAMASRLAGQKFDLVVSSDLARAADTAAALGFEVERDPVWREMHLGVWEGRTFEEVRGSHPDLLEAIRRGEAAAFGETGETLAEFEARAAEAFEALAARVGEGNVLVATHGGVIDAIVGRYLGRVPGRRTFPIVTNTALTRLVGEPGRMRLSKFNDATHLGVDVGFLGRMRSEQIPVLGFLRHGVTQANKEDRIQGQTCWGLDSEGLEQARAFASWYGEVDRVVSSPLPRAQETAGVLSEEFEIEPAVQEMGFGEWEGMLSDDLRASEDGLAAKIYRHGEDLPRGGTGESLGQLITRMKAFLDGFDADGAQRTVVVSHGGAIRALVAAITENQGAPHTLMTPENTAISHVAITPSGPVLADFSLAPHLEVAAGTCG